MKKMTKKILVTLLLVTPLIYGSHTFADNEKPLKEKIKEFNKKFSEKGLRKVDNMLRKEIRDFLIKNKDISAKNFKRMREVRPAVRIARMDFYDRYGVRASHYKGKIKDREEREYYKIVRKLTIMGGKYRAEYLCSSGDEEAAIVLRKKIKSFMKKKNTKSFTPERIEALKYVRGNLCPYGANNGLLDEYRKNEDVKNYNETMLWIIKKDQVEYDYMYNSDGEIIDFRGYYRSFLRSLTRSIDEHGMKVEELETVANALLTKHADLFLTGSYEDYNYEGSENRLIDTVVPIISFVKLLNKKGFYELSDQLIEKFLLRKMALLTVKDYIEDFAAYIEKWEAVGRKSRDVKVIF